MEFEKRVTPVMYKIIRDISLTKTKTTVNRSSLAKLINKSPHDPLYNYTLNFLIKNDLIGIRAGIGKSQLLTINYKKLRDFIDELPETQEWFKYFFHYHFITW